MTRPARALAALGLLFVLAAPRRADACWDGWRAETRAVSIARGYADVSWSPEHARLATRWAARFDALVPAGVKLEIRDDGLRCSGHPACAAIDPDLGFAEPTSLFEHLAEVFRVAPRDRAAARARETPIYTVQIFAGGSGAARAVRAELDARWRRDELELPSDAAFFEEGGFPAHNSPIHAVEAGAVVRVVVGTFPSWAAAEEARARIELSRLEGFVRLLPQGGALDEAVWTSAG